MALLGNYNIFNKNVIQNTGGDSLSGITGLRYNWNQSGTGRFYGETWIVGVADRCGVPNGYSAPYSFKLPPKTGGLGSNVGVRGSGAFTGSGALGRNIESIMEGSGTISNANLGLILSAVATLSGIGGLSADVLGALQASATLAGQGDMSASLGALAGAVATLSGSGTMDNDITAKASLSADIYVNQSEASVQQIVSGVWNALAINYNTSGTMGEAAQASGGGGGGGATAAQIWAYSDRTLTESAGLTEEQDAMLKAINRKNGVLVNQGDSLTKQQEIWLKETREIVERTEGKIDDLPTPDLSKIESNIESSLSIAKTEILDRIKSSSKSLESEVQSELKSVNKELKEDNIETRNLIRQKANKQEEFIQKQLDSEAKTQEIIEDEADEIESEIEKILNEEADMIEKDMEDKFNQEADEIESELTNQKQDGND